MKRRIFNIVSGLSLVLCLATVGLWVRSCFVLDTIAYPRIVPQGNSNAAVAHAISLPIAGVFYVYSRIPTVPPNFQPKTPGGRVTWTSIGPRQIVPKIWWFVCADSTLPGPTAIGGLRKTFVLYIPYWCPCLMLAILPAWWLMRARRQHGRAKAGLCLV